MGRLSGNGEATFVILEGDQLYSESAFEQICTRNTIPEPHHGTLKRLLEQIGAVYLDQMALVGRPSQTFRLRQDLHLGLRLLIQLKDVLPRADDLRPNINSGEDAHAAALREGERQVQADQAPVGVSGLSEACESIGYLRDVYEAALESAGRASRGAAERERAEARWRAPLVEFYTRTLSRSWTGSMNVHGGERFLADCLAVLTDHEVKFQDFEDEEEVEVLETDQ